MHGTAEKPKSWTKEKENVAKQKNKTSKPKIHQGMQLWSYLNTYFLFT